MVSPDPSITKTLSENKLGRGYRGIWYNLGQDKGYGPKYSGGLGTYPANMVPMAVCDPREERVYFVYGGSKPDNRKDLQIMIGTFDTKTHKLRRPTTIRDSGGLPDAHANPSIGMDDQGYIFVFSATRHDFEGRIYRSLNPRDTSGFEVVYTGYLAYPQPWFHPQRGWVLLHTQYHQGERHLYSQRSPDGIHWDEPIPYAAFHGHYQNSAQHADGSITTAFNTHPGGLDHRTQVYVITSSDGGISWTDLEGRSLDLPLQSMDNSALALDARKQNNLTYIMDLAVTEEGEPVVLFLTSKDSATGPKGGDRIWKTLHHQSSKGWYEKPVGSSSHNYDCGSLLIDGSHWKIIGPTGIGPQGVHTGGEIEAFTSSDQGDSWERKPLTQRSLQNHTYAKKTIPSHASFVAFWADGHPTEESDSHLYFCNSEGDVFRMPKDMNEEWESPLKLPNPS